VLRVLQVFEQSHDGIGDAIDAREEALGDDSDAHASTVRSIL
jgi:hypothetical protein